MEIQYDPQRSETIKRAVIARLGSPYLTTAQAAHYCRLSERTMKQMRADGRGPRYHKIDGRFVRYHIDDLDDWLQARQPQPDLFDR
jgi:excisionase family DNA binding protein